MSDKTMNVITLRDELDRLRAENETLREFAAKTNDQKNLLLREQRLASEKPIKITDNLMPERIGAWFKLSCATGTGHFFMAYVLSGDSIPLCCAEHSNPSDKGGEA